MIENLIETIEGFDWDEGNKQKSDLKHKVSNGESEEIFFNKPLLIAEDEKHSVNENRFFALGKTNNGKKLFCVFTVRKNLIRVISIRDMNKKEQVVYEKN